MLDEYQQEFRTYQTNRDDKDFSRVHKERVHYAVNLRSDSGARERDLIHKAFTPNVGIKPTKHDLSTSFRCCEGATLIGQSDCGNCSQCGKFFILKVSSNKRCDTFWRKMDKFFKLYEKKIVILGQNFHQNLWSRKCGSTLATLQSNSPFWLTAKAPSSKRTIFWTGKL